MLTQLFVLLFQKKFAYGAVMFVGMLSLPAYFAVNIKHYRGDIKEH